MEETFDHAPGKEKDQVSPMFISEHQRKTNVCRFCALITHIFSYFLKFVELYVYFISWTLSLKRIYASLSTFGYFSHHRTMILKVERTFKKRAKTVERNSTTCECIFHQLAVKNVNVNVVIKIYCRRNSIFLRPKKNYSLHYLTGQIRGLSGLKNIWPVIMTGDLLSVIFSPAAQ